MSSKTDSISTRRWARLQDIFDQALDLPENERAAFVQKTCGDDQELKNQVEALIVAADSDRELVGSLIRSAADRMLDSSQRTRTQIGQYRVTDTIGSGGMGVVYLGQRDDAEYQQQVAIKILHDGLTSDETQRRFLAERQILADLNHPNIARLLDGGRTDDGQPYLVMEYIDGEPLVEYCDRHQLNINKRLELFRQVCSAVAAAHRSLIVHRDIKPNNILVGSDGVPKLLDFGIAKVLNNRLRDIDLAKTQLGDRLLTPDNASPEQVLGLPVTTSSDIYSLGVLLYQLLCGSRPFSLTNATPAEMERIICDEIPVSPSHVIGASNHDDDDIRRIVAARRASSPARLQKQLRGELDYIVLMALKKEPHRRYASASQLATDIDRYQQGLPIVAARDTRRYRAAKFISRNRVGVAAASVFVLALSAFSVTTWMQSKEIAAKAAEVIREKEEVEGALGFLTDVFESTNPYRLQKKNVLARDFLEVGANKLVTDSYADKPEMRARLERIFGLGFAAHRELERARELLLSSLELTRQEYGEEHPRVADVLQNLGNVYATSDWQKAELYFTESLAIFRNQTSADYFLENPAKHQAAIQYVLQDIAGVEMQRGNLENARTYLEEALDIVNGIKHLSEYARQEALIMQALGALHRRGGEYDKTEQYLSDALTITRQVFGEQHTEVADVLDSMALTAHARGNLDQAEELYKNSLAMRENVFGKNANQLVPAKANFGRFLRDRGEYEQAERLLSHVIMANRQIQGEDSYQLGFDMVELAKVHTELKQFEKAEALFAEAIELYARTIGTEHNFYAEALRQRGNLRIRQNKHAEAVPLFEQAIRILLDVRGDEHWQTAASRSEKAAAHLALNEDDEAEQLLNQAEPVLVKSLGESHRLVVATRQRQARLAASREVVQE